MNIFDILGIKAAIDDIDLQMTPWTHMAFLNAVVICKGFGVIKKGTIIFFIDNWRKPSSLCFMEWGIRHAKILATIKAPQELIDNCIVMQGKIFKKIVMSLMNQYVFGSRKISLPDRIHQKLLLKSLNRNQILLQDCCLKFPILILRNRKCFAT